MTRKRKVPSLCLLMGYASSAGDRLDTFVLVRVFEITFTLDDKRQMDCKQISIIFRVKTNVVMMFSSLLLIHSEIKLLLILYHTKTDTPIK